MDYSRHPFMILNTNVCDKSNQCCQNCIVLKHPLFVVLFCIF
nr:MAG TPA: DAP10 membrane protein [Bacteriophage sp.]